MILWHGVLIDEHSLWILHIFLLIINKPYEIRKHFCLQNFHEMMTRHRDVCILMDFCAFLSHRMMLVYSGCTTKAGIMVE